MERFQNLQGFKWKASSAPRKRLPNHDALLKAYKGESPEERIKDLVRQHRTAPPQERAQASEEGQVDDMVCLLVQALTTARREWHDLRSFLAFVKKGKGPDVASALCEDVLQWDVNVDESQRVVNAVLAFYDTLRSLATSVLHD